MVLNVEIVKKIDFYQKQLIIYRKFLDLIEESIMRDEYNPNNIILAKDLLHEKLKKILIDNFNLKRFIDKVKEMYSEMMEQFPKCLTKQLIFESADF